MCNQFVYIYKEMYERRWPVWAVSQKFVCFALCVSTTTRERSKLSSVVEGDPNQLVFLKSVLNSFADSTGLKINYSKTMMLPINLSEDRLDLLARTFGCSKGTLPFPYLGLPLGLTRTTVQEYLPLVHRCLGGLS